MHIDNSCTIHEYANNLSFLKSISYTCFPLRLEMNIKSQQNYILLFHVSGYSTRNFQKTFIQEKITVKWSERTTWSPSYESLTKWELGCGGWMTCGEVLQYVLHNAVLLSAHVLLISAQMPSGSDYFQAHLANKSGAWVSLAAMCRAGAQQQNSSSMPFMGRLRRRLGNNSLKIEAKTSKSIFIIIWIFWLLLKINLKK